MTKPPKIPDYTDNEKFHLSTVLRDLIEVYEEREADIATGFFSPSVWGVLGSTLEQLESLRLMLGKEPDLPLEKRGLKLVQYYRRKLKEELEGSRLDSARVRDIDALIAFLGRDSVQVRLFNDPFLHAKAYIFSSYNIVGSSNFTYNGLMGNSELNTVTKNDAMTRELKTGWFDRFWHRAEDYKTALIEELERSKFGTHPYTPHDIFLKVLFENFRDTIALEEEHADAGSAVRLAEFQLEGFKQALGLLERFGSVMIADAVGLGKSFMGLGLLEEFLIRRRANYSGRVPRALVVCPAQLEKLVWRPLLERYGIPAQVVSMESMGREDFDWQRYRDSDLLVIDESHNFRNPGTGRYVNLLRMVSSGDSNKKVVMLTATPVNNTIWDFYHQVLLMNRGRDDAYRNYGIPSLKGFFKEVSKGRAEFYDLIEHAMVRRSRRDVKRRQEQGESVIIAGQEIHFPERHLHRVEYSLTDQFGNLYPEFVRRIGGLKLVAYNLERYKRDSDPTQVSQREALSGIFITNFLKRFESSVHALSTSLANQRRFQERFYEHFKEGRLLDGGTNRRLEQLMRLAGGEDDTEGNQTEQSKQEKLLASLPEVNKLEYRISDMERDIQQDLEALRWMEGTLRTLLASRGHGGEQDSKMTAIKQTLLERAAGKGHKKTIVFSYFHDTAEYIYRSLINDSEWLHAMNLTAERVAFLSGNSSGEMRSDVVRRFAPNANRRHEDDDREYERLLSRPIDLLISTDVLSEGQNLQDAGFLLNADLHWNPVRMIQRAGRIDRLGSQFEQLEIANVFPEEGLDDVLGLVRRLQDRIAAIDSSVGLDASVLGEVISKKSFEELGRIRAEDATVLDELEQEGELGYGDEMRLPLIAALQDFGESIVQDIPLGIHSYKATPEAPQHVFFAFRARDRVLWRVYPVSGEAPVITSKREIFRLIQAQYHTPRVEGNPPKDIFPLLDRALGDVLREFKRSTRTSAFKRRLTGANAQLSQWLQRLDVAEVTSAERRAALFYSLTERPLIGFERDPIFKQMLASLPQLTAEQSVDAIETFLVDNGLLITPPTQKTVIEELTQEQIELIAYEWLE